MHLVEGLDERIRLLLRLRRVEGDGGRFERGCCSRAGIAAGGGARGAGAACEEDASEAEGRERGRGAEGVHDDLTVRGESGSGVLRGGGSGRQEERGGRFWEGEGSGRGRRFGAK
ncbi:hypothetical protein ACFPRL_14240 [Pseudoclavibacter helvolus]